MWSDVCGIHLKEEPRWEPELPPLNLFTPRTLKRSWKRMSTRMWYTVKTGKEPPVWLTNVQAQAYIRQITNEIASISKADASSSFSFTRISTFTRNWWRRTACIVQLVGVYSRIIMQYCMYRFENYMGGGTGIEIWLFYAIRINQSLALQRLHCRPSSPLMHLTRKRWIRTSGWYLVGRKHAIRKLNPKALANGRPCLG